jgi:hypothetical protein
MTKWEIPEAVKEPQVPVWFLKEQRIVWPPSQEMVPRLHFEFRPS